MTTEEVKALIEETAEVAANKVLNKLKSQGRIRYYFTDSFKKTEELLYLIPKLPEDHPEVKRVMKALEKIKDDEYGDVIVSKYFDGTTLNELSEIYDCTYKNILKQRNRLIKILTKELFPEDVVNELLQK